MNKNQFRECLNALHWPTATVSEVLSVPFSTTKEWLLGHSEVPPNVALWLETLARAHQQAPIPEMEGGKGTQGEAGGEEPGDTDAEPHVELQHPD